MRALVIDDSRAMRAILKKFMIEAGFEVVEACHGKQALERISADDCPDVALVDWNLPEMNGLEFLRAIRTESGFDSMKVIMVTTEIEKERIAKALNAGANEYVMKPFTKDMIVDKLALVGLAVAV